MPRLRTVFGGVQAEYARARGRARWADKSPRYALHLPFLHRLFPDAQFVHLIRDGCDVAVSHRRRYGYWSSVKASVKWPRYITTARGAGASMGGDTDYELRYDQLVTHPERTLTELLAFLGEEWDPEILAFTQATHDVPDSYRQQLAERAASADTDASVYASRVGAYRSELDPLVRSLFWVTSRRLLRQLGY